MPKMTTREIRERAVELLRTQTAGIRWLDLVRTLSPETPVSTIRTQVGQLPAHYPNLVFRPSHGLLQLWENASIESLSTPPDGATVVQPKMARTPAMLKSLGFVPAGTWAIDGPHLRCDFFEHENRSPVLYAFVIGGRGHSRREVGEDIGERIGHYGSPGSSQLTSLRVNACIRDSLSQGQTVGLWVLADWKPLEHHGIPINVAAGIEDELIARMAPPWNGGRAKARGTLAG